MKVIATAFSTDVNGNLLLNKYGRMNRNKQKIEKRQGGRMKGLACCYSIMLNQMRLKSFNSVSMLGDWVPVLLLSVRVFKILLFLLFGFEFTCE